ncbi:hypothetical protein [Frateuria soli]|uniref:hypothetical protein n=1 Tax=Frateuria soli TaxID=1542730 RepID=UPI001E53DA20|nr:hypothetical protein [Frateuria soli]UGB38272.1 hypothetical protein LQ771_15925 [Frateuria soli]
MKIALCTLLAVALAAQPLMLQAAQAPAQSAKPEKPAKPAKPSKPKVAGTRQAVGSGVDMETVELSLLAGGIAVALLVGASGGGKHDKDCHCHGGGGTTGTTPAH